MKVRCINFYLLCMLLIGALGQTGRAQERPLAPERLLPPPRAIPAGGDYHDILLQQLRAARALSQQQGNRLEEGTILARIGGVQEALGQYAEARKSYQQALTVFQQAAASLSTVGAHPMKGVIWGHLGALHLSLGQPAKAHKAYQQALNAYEQALKPLRHLGDRLGQGQLLTSLGGIHEALGQAAEAQKAYQQALQAYQQALEPYRDLPSHPTKSVIWGHLGALYLYLEHYPQAREAYQQALAGPHDLITTGGLWKSIGFTYQQQQQYLEALLAYAQAQAIFEQFRQPFEAGMVLSHIGEIYQTLGRYDKARQTFEKARERHHEALNRFGEASSLTNIGAVYMAQEQYPKAREHFEQARQIWKALPHRLGEGIALAHLGIAYNALKRPQEALGAFEQALGRFGERGQHAPSSPDQFLLLGMGAAQHALAQPTEALRFFQQALTISEALQDHEGLWQSHTGMARVLHTLGHRPDALSHYRRAADMLEAIRQHVRNWGVTTGFLPQVGVYHKRSVYRDLVPLLLQLHREEPARQYAHEAFHYAERGKARAFLEQLAKARSGIRKGVDLELLTQEDNLYAKLAKMSSRLAQPQPEAQPSTWQKEFHTLTQQLETLQQQLRSTAPRYAALVYPQPLSVDQVQRLLLRDGEVLLEYFWGTDALHLLVIDHREVYPLTFPVDEQKLHEAITALLKPFRQVQTSMDRRTRAAQLQQFDLSLAYTLYQQLVEPAVPYLPAGAPLVIIPDGILHDLPFELLVTRPAPASQRTAPTYYRDAAYLIRQHPIGYAPSASALHPELRKPAQQHVPAKTLLALAPFAKPSRLEQLLAWAKQPLALAPASLVAPLRQLDPTRATPAALLLPHTAQEVRALQTLFAPDTTVLFETQATKAVVQTQATDYRYLHLATHGFVDDTHPMASGLLLHDGVLHAHDIFKLELHADLVVLSACNTGRGTLQSGEGLIGLTRALMTAGTPAVVASLWPVDDALTAQFMQAFYQRLQKRETTVQALQQAKVALMRHHPFYWAPFVLWGDWR